MLKGHEEALKEIKEHLVEMVRVLRIPIWFDHMAKRGIPVFKARWKRKVIVIILDVSGMELICTCPLMVNVYLVDDTVSSLLWRIMCCSFAGEFMCTKQETNMEDIEFEIPDPISLEIRQPRPLVPITEEDELRNRIASSNLPAIFRDLLKKKEEDKDVLIREIVKHEAPGQVGKRSKLWYYGCLNGAIIPARILSRESCDNQFTQKSSCTGKAIFQRFEHLTYMTISYCAATKFPDVSGANNLRELRLDKCMKLVAVHESIGHLPNLVYLRAPECSKLIRLAQFPDIVGKFSKLERLKCTGNQFVSLLAHIKESIYLTSLDVIRCKKLKNIPELPSSIQKIDARLCNSLSRKTARMLWSQKVDDVTADSYGEDWQGVGLHLFIEGEQYHKFIVAEDHVLLCELRVLFSDEEWEGLDACIEQDWKTIKIDCETDLSLHCWGVYMYKEETNMENIEFKIPDPCSS
ncbi:hypothetical protein VNO77_39920 [Canavalia gladiata]|uniref:Uncharacterized protein n=1 Tax=Canavalia gladiata TaxID=3824 RepID=A0AAN9JXB3_CANGL